MEIPVIGFIPPMVGMKGRFNTFRPGGGYHKRLAVGQEIYLLDTKNQVLFGRAIVTKTDVGPLEEMLSKHAHANHTQKGKPRASAAGELADVILRIYGPRIIVPGKRTSVIYLRRVE